MNWFKHKADEHASYILTDANRKFGHIAYKIYFIMHEVYAKNYNERDDDDYVKISMGHVTKICNINERNVKQILIYFQKKEKMNIKINKDMIFLKILNFSSLHDRWQDNKSEKLSKFQGKSSIEVEDEAEEEVENMFDVFWKEYPRKVSKENTRKIWKRLKLEKELCEKIIKAVKEQIETGMINTKDIKYCPHPSTWLSQKRWEDKIDNEQGAAAHCEEKKEKNEKNERRTITIHT